MPFILKPSYRSISVDGVDKAALIPFTYDFATDTIQDTRINVNGLQVTGTMLEIDPQSLKTVLGDIKFKAIEFTIAFYGFFDGVTADSFIDGPCYIYVPTTGQVVTIPPPIANDNVAAPGNARGYFKSGVVSLSCSETSTVRIIKQAGVQLSNGTRVLKGYILATLFNYERENYTIEGTAYDATFSSQ